MALVTRVSIASATSGSLHMVSDLLAQFIQHQATPNEPFNVNLSRTAKFMTIGFVLHGPYFFFVYRSLDAVFGSIPTMGCVITKALFGQVTAFPLYLLIFYSARSALDGNSPSQTLDSLRKNYLQSYLAGWLVWPATSVVLFRFVPLRFRVFGANIVGIFWQAYLSRKSSLKPMLI